MGRGIDCNKPGKDLRSYFDFFACLAFLFSWMDFKGFFLTSFLASLDFAITHLSFNLHYVYILYQTPLFISID